MVVSEKQIFNLMNTNGRRSDVLNALKIYLEILQELNITHPFEGWDKYPSSTKQILFYEKALELSKDVFKIHKNYDAFLDNIGKDHEKMLGKSKEWVQSSFPKYAEIIDESIEQRSRHYTSNLVKIGFTDSDRKITEPGYSFLNNKVARDAIETLLPIGDTNIVLIRQLLKLKIFSEPNTEGFRTFYSPFLMAIYLLLRDEWVDKSQFSLIIQRLNPYINKSIQNKIATDDINIDELIEYVNAVEVAVPDEIAKTDILAKEQIKKFFKTSKESDKITEIYYNFYICLRTFVLLKNEENYNNLIKVLDDNSDYLKKAFGYGSNIFKMDNRKSCIDLDEFIKLNYKNILLDFQNFNENFFTTYKLSKEADGVKEYSDTTLRLFSASGLFKFRNLPELAHKKVINLLFDKFNIKNNIFGVLSEEEYEKYESNEDSYLFQNLSVTEILGYSDNENIDIVNGVLSHLNVSSLSEAKTSLVNDTNIELTSYIKENYPKGRVIELLKMFSDRKLDSKIKREVNESAPVPTIYEYIVAIAWFYISDSDFDLYESMNLTLNADFEPVMHAGGGAGDIVISYDKSVVMLEVTLMNKQAQKRGEWEPVLRHSLNLKADNIEKETITFFIADELDMNTINIWRAVAAAPLESTTNKTQVDGVVIMPLTNTILVDFLLKNICKNSIIEATKESFAKVPKITDMNWHEDVVNQLVLGGNI